MASSTTEVCVHVNVCHLTCESSSPRRFSLTLLSKVDVAGTSLKLEVRIKDCKCSITGAAGCIHRGCGPKKNAGFTSLFSARVKKAGALTAAETPKVEKEIGVQYAKYQDSRKGTSAAISASMGTGAAVANFGKLCSGSAPAASPVSNTGAKCSLPAGFTGVTVPSHLQANQRIIQTNILLTPVFRSLLNRL